MTGRIYLIDENDTLRALPERPYDSEDLLQGLLEKYPDLLAGEQMNEDAPRRWLLVDREYGVPGEEEGTDRWSLDHLFLDQDAVPTLVEVKRSSDTRIRREVVGQMLDYAANAVVYWPLSRIRHAFEAAADERGEDPVQLLLQLIGDDEGEDAVEAFWERVKTNLQAGRIRMVFVADRIPVELRRIVEFMNEQMDPAEVLAVEVKQFVGDGMRTLVPKVIGQTASAIQKKRASTASGTTWTEERFLPELAKRHGAEAAAIAKKILDWAARRGLEISWGNGARSGSLFPVLGHGRDAYTFAALWTYGRVEMQFQHMRGPFEGEAARAELLRQINEIPGVSLDPTKVTARPGFHITALADPENMSRFLELWEEYLERIKSA